MKLYGMSADHSETAKVEHALREATRGLHRMVPDVALARQVREFSSERRKTLLARYTSPLLMSHSSVSAETIARGMGEYQSELDTLEAQYRDAEAVIAKWQATQATFEAARSLMSMNKELLRQIE